MNYSPNRLFMPHRYDPDAAVITYLKESALPIIVYGTGDCGQATARYLVKYGISSFEYAIDDIGTPPHFMEDKGTISNPLFPHETDAKYSSYNLIIAIQSKLFSFCPQFNNASKVLNLHNVYDYFGSMTNQFISDNADLFMETACLFADDLSRDTLFAFIKARTVNDTEALIPFGSLNTYFRRDLFTLPHNICFVDCGAYSGDTISVFIKEYNTFSKIIAFEPSKKNAEKIQRFVIENNLLNISIIEKGCWDSNTMLSFSDDGSEGSKVNDCGETIVNVVKLDDYTSGISEPIMIKMDIEGAELAALRGAEKTIIRHKPLLAICVYHKIEDIITIPQYIKALVPSYKLYLKISAGGAFVGGVGMVLFAVPPQFENR